MVTEDDDQANDESGGLSVAETHEKSNGQYPNNNAHDADDGDGDTFDDNLYILCLERIRVFFFVTADPVPGR